MAYRTRNFKGVMTSDDARHARESILTAVALAGDPVYGKQIIDALGSIEKPSYPGEVNLPTEMTKYMLRRGDFWNVKQQMSVLGLSGGENAPQAIEYIMEAFRVMHGGYKPLPVEAKAPRKPKAPKSGGERVAEKESEREAIAE